MEKLFIAPSELVYVLETNGETGKYFVEAHRFLAEVQIGNTPAQFVIAVPVCWSADEFEFAVELGKQCGLVLDGEPTDLMIFPRGYCFESFEKADAAGQEWEQAFRDFNEQQAVEAEEPDE